MDATSVTSGVTSSFLSGAVSFVSTGFLTSSKASFTAGTLSVGSPSSVAAPADPVVAVSSLAALFAAAVSSVPFPASLTFTDVPSLTVLPPTFSFGVASVFFFEGTLGSPGRTVSFSGTGTGMSFSPFSFPAQPTSIAIRDADVKSLRIFTCISVLAVKKLFKFFLLCSKCRMFRLV